MKRAWLVRAGSRGEHWDTFLAEEVVAVGWPAIEDLAAASTRDDVRVLIAAGYPNSPASRLANWTGQLSRFRHQIAADDLVVTPLRQTNTVAIGVVAGGYTYRPDLPEDLRHTLPVKWIRTDLARTVFGQNLLYSLGSLLTVAEVSRNDAVRRLEHLAEHGIDPGTADLDISGDQESDITSLNLETIAYDRINNFLGEQLSGDDMAWLVEAIFQANGLTTYRSPKGPDGGFDVLAGGGPLGMDPPRICVQVKFRAGPVEAEVVRALEGVMNRIRADQGLLVSWNGITQAARREIRERFFHIRVWTADDVLRELTSVYDRLPEEIRLRLPLKRVWMLATEDPDSTVKE
jgi:restriction system protein